MKHHTLVKMPSVSTDGSNSTGPKSVPSTITGHPQYSLPAVGVMSTFLGKKGFLDQAGMIELFAPISGSVAKIMFNAYPTINRIYDGTTHFFRKT